jgi:hypothetical protein
MAPSPNWVKMTRRRREDKLKLHATHIFNCSVQRFWEIFWDKEYAQMLDAETGVRREILWNREDDTCRVWRVKVIPDDDLPGPVAKVAGTKKFIYEQENQLDRATHCMKWRVIPALQSGKIRAEGTMTIRAIPTGVERVVEGEVQVRIPLVGKRIEKAVVNSVTRSYDKAAEATQKWLLSHP